MPLKMNNNRRYPDANHQPRHKANSRKQDSLERQEAYDKLSLEEKVKRLDETLGVGVGATKQRARLASLMFKRDNKPSSKEDGDQTNKSNQKKGSK